MAPASFHKTAEVYENDKAHEPGIPGEQLSLGMVAVPTPFHSGVVLEHWKRLHHWICHPDEAIPVDGKHLEISQVVAIARFVSCSSLFTQSSCRLPGYVTVKSTD